MHLLGQRRKNRGIQVTAHAGYALDVCRVLYIMCIAFHSQRNIVGRC